MEIISTEIPMAKKSFMNGGNHKRLMILPFIPSQLSKVAMPLTPFKESCIQCD